MKKITSLSVLALLFVTGCENTMRSDANELDSFELQELSSELQYDLGLSKSSSDALNKSLSRHGKKGKHREPGFLWKVAADMSDTMTDEEKAVLFEKMDEKEVPLFGFGKKKKGKSGNKGKKPGLSIYKILSDDQKVTYKAMMADYKEKFGALRSQVKDGTISKDDAKAQRKALKDAMSAEIDALLTDDQKDQIQRNKEAKKAKHQAYRDSSRSVMVSTLKMSNNQVSAYDAAMQEAKDAAKTLFEQSKNGDIDKETLRVSLKTLFSDRNKKLEAIFDVKQLDIIKIHKALSMRAKKHRSSKGNKGKKGNRK